jgi:hypothetical protein
MDPVEGMERADLSGQLSRQELRRLAVFENPQAVDEPIGAFSAGEFSVGTGQVTVVYPERLAHSEHFQQLIVGKIIAVVKARILVDYLPEILGHQQSPPAARPTFSENLKILSNFPSKNLLF